MASRDIPVTAVPARPEVRQISVPDSARSRGALGRIDYADTFVLSGVAPTNRTGEEWCRAVLDAASPRLRARLVLGWSALGLRLGAPWSPHRVLGWAIRRRSAESVLLGAGSYIGMPAELLFERRPDGLLFATFVSLRNPAVRGLWSRVQDTHVEVVGSLLPRAAMSAG